MRHLITGGSGFVGDLAARELFKRGEQVRVLDIWEDPSRPRGIEFVHCSVLNRDGVAAAMRGVDVVHQEHAPVRLAPGTWRIRRQREMDPKETRLVAD